MQQLAGKGSWDKVAALLDPVLETSSDCVPAQLLAAQAYMDTGDAERCIMATGRALKVQGSNVEALLLRGKAFFHLEVLCLLLLSL